MLFSILCMRSSSKSPGIARSLGVVSGVVLGLVATFWALLSVLRETAAVIFGPGRAAVDELVTAISAAAALVLLVWVAIGLLVSVLAAIPGPWSAASSHLQDYVAPATVRRWAALLLGATIVSTITPAGAAATLPTSSVSAPAPGWVTDESSTTSTDETEAPAPAWTPALTRSLPSVSLTTPRPTPTDTEAHEVTVRRGDTLWDLAAAHLPTEATDAEIAASWQRWHLENRDVIGSDPDLILPGQILTVPTHEPASAEVSP